MRSQLFFYWCLCAVLVSTSAIPNRRGRLNRGIPLPTVPSNVSSVLPSTDSDSLEPSELNSTARSDVEIFDAETSLPHLNERIIGGSDADYKNHPYQLQLAVNGKHTCGAVIISKLWAVTAAHCLVDEDREVASPESVTVRAGAATVDVGGTVHRVRKVVVRKDYDDVEYDNDIALLKLKDPFQYGPNVQRVLLPQAGEGVPEGTMGVVTGWGLVKTGGKSSLVLQNVSLPIVSHKKCKANYRRKHVLITERMICAGFPQAHRDFCQGDSGGPMVVNGKLVGIISWSIGCGRPGFPGVFTKVAKFRHWIRQKSGV